MALNVDGYDNTKTHYKTMKRLDFSINFIDKIHTNIYTVSIKQSHFI